jgi:hydroxyacylglutathione hydrolase
LTKEDLAGYLYDSLHDKIMTLPDEVIVYPAHGAGSACGKNMSKETFDTLGHQKEVNYALKAASKEQFIREVTDGILPPPAYFPQNVAMNKGTIPSLAQVKEKGLRALAPGPTGAAGGKRRSAGAGHAGAQTFKDGFVPRSINIGLTGRFRAVGGHLDPRREAPAGAGVR